jgi:hypothetical protein
MRWRMVLLILLLGVPIGERRIHLFLCSLLNSYNAFV